MNFTKRFEEQLFDTKHFLLESIETKQSLNPKSDSFGYQGLVKSSKPFPKAWEINTLGHADSRFPLAFLQLWSLEDYPISNAQQRFTASSNALFHAKPQLEITHSEVGSFKTANFVFLNEMRSTWIMTPYMYGCVRNRSCLYDTFFSSNIFRTSIYTGQSGFNLTLKKTGHWQEQNSSSFPMKSMKSPVFQQTQTIHVYPCMVYIPTLGNAGKYTIHRWYGKFHWRFPGDMNHPPSAAVDVLHHPAVVVTAAGWVYAVGFGGGGSNK